MQLKDKVFSLILPSISKPGRYIGNELNMCKKDWSQAKTRMAFAFPDIYEVGMSHIGGKILYGLINEKSDHLMERVFAPWPDMEMLMRQEDIPLFSLESFMPLKAFDIIGFSLQYELSLTNVLNMLDLAHIEAWADKRKEEDPLIIAGGPLAFNPEPFAGFFDLIVVGEGEEVLLQVLDLVGESKDRGRAALLQQLAQIEGVYVPSLYQVEYEEDGRVKEMRPVHKKVPSKVRKRVIRNFDRSYYPAEPVLPYIEIVHDRAVIEVMRGCHRACRFCQAGMIYRPLREKSLQTVEEQTRQQIQATGYDEISLCSLSTLDYSRASQLVHDLVEDYGHKGIGISLPSLRVDALSIQLAHEVQKVRKTTLTLAPEAGTQRLRNRINKNVNEEDLFKAVEAAFSAGWKSLKFYFMLGLPGETSEDVEEIIILLKRIRETGRKLSRRPVEIKASLAYFVPKAHTPFQWQPQAGIETYQASKKTLLSLKSKGIQLNFHDSRASLLEGLIARGDRRLSPVIHQAWKNGCKFDAWTEFFDYDKWQDAMEANDVDPSFYTHRPRRYDEVLPWDFIDTGINKEYLMAEDQRAKLELLTPDCRQGVCVGCGICANFDLKMELKGEGQHASEG